MKSNRIVGFGVKSGQVGERGRRLKDSAAGSDGAMSNPRALAGLSRKHHAEFGTGRSTGQSVVMPALDVIKEADWGGWFLGS